jgi:hypothetical protein
MKKPIMIDNEQFYYKFYDVYYPITRFYKRYERTSLFFLFDLIDWLLDLDLKYTYRYKYVFSVHEDIENLALTREDVKYKVTAAYVEYKNKQRRLEEIQNGKIL